MQDLLVVSVNERHGENMLNIDISPWGGLPYETDGDARRLA